MLRKLLGARRTNTRALPAVPAGRRIYAIGDIHGCITELDRLLALVQADDDARPTADTTLIFVGDLIDRGPASADVVERLLNLRGDARFIMGNHEEIFLSALAGDMKALRMFTRIGGRETILSYGLDGPGYESLDYDQLLAWLTSIVPVAHRDFIAGFEDMIVIGDYAFVHAGVRPDRALDDQSKSDLRWIREQFLSNRRPLSKMIVHGHTIVNEVEQTPARISIDTGAYATGRLTAIGLDGCDRWLLHSA